MVLNFYILIFLYNELTEMVKYQDISIDLQISTKTYNYITITTPTGYRLFAVNTMNNSLALFAQPCEFGAQTRLSLYNTLNETGTFDQPIRVWFIKE